jgi:hypothetical protein
MSDRMCEILDPLVTGDWPDERRRCNFGRFPSDGEAIVSDSVPDSVVFVPESDRPSSTSSGVFLILH